MAQRISQIAVIILFVAGVVLMGLAFKEYVHPMVGVGVLCSTILPCCLVSLIRSCGGQPFIDAYTPLSADDHD